MANNCPGRPEPTLIMRGGETIGSKGENEMRENFSFVPLQSLRFYSLHAHFMSMVLQSFNYHRKIKKIKVANSFPCLEVMCSL